MPDAEDRLPPRPAILARYWDRITRKEKTKLTQNEQTDLIADFIADLQQLDTPEAIKHRCAQEMRLLEEGYPIATIASRLLAPYRKAIKDAIDAGTLPLNDRTGHIVRYTKRATGEEYEPATYAALRGQTIEHNNARQDDLQPVQVEPYLAKVNELFSPDEPHALTTAIAAATGRRHTEVAVHGTFEPTGHPSVLRFTGQQKKRDGHLDASTPFAIVTLIPVQAQSAFSSCSYVPVLPSAMDGFSFRTYRWSCHYGDSVYP